MEDTFGVAKISNLSSNLTLLNAYKWAFGLVGFCPVGFCPSVILS